MTKNAARLRVSLELLADRLELPVGARVTSISQQADDILRGTFQVVVEHPNLPIWQEGAEAALLITEQIREAVTLNDRAKEFAEDVKRHRIRMP